MSRKIRFFVISTLLLSLMLAPAIGVNAQDDGDKWCSDLNIVFFADELKSGFELEVAVGQKMLITDKS